MIKAKVQVTNEGTSRAESKAEETEMEERSELTRLSRNRDSTVQFRSIRRSRVTEGT
jgi:hypothetical protein